jgi:DNA-binding transcriptional MocR family regulator
VCSLTPTIRPAANVLFEGKEKLELAVQGYLEGVGVSLLSQWDVLAFLYRHGASLSSVEQIARLLGYESAVVGGALEHLEREKLIERSRSSRGVRLHRISTSTDAERQRCLEHLVSLSGSRAGRLLLTKQLKLGGRNRRETNKRLRLESEGKWLCLKAS